MDGLNGCACKGSNLDKMVQPAILLALANEELHGYKIIQKISKTALFNGNKPDPTGVYRHLKAMESMGLIISSWDTANSGPARRIFKITEDGYECLHTWISTLEDYKNTIEKFLAEAKTVMDNSPINKSR